MENNKDDYTHFLKPIPLLKAAKLTKKALKSVCIVETEEISGSAGFYFFESTSGTRHCLISCHHLLPPEQVLTATFQFKWHKFSLKEDWIGQVSFKPKFEGDFIVIELKSKAINILKSIGVSFLKVSGPQTGDQFLIIQYPDKDLCLGHGSIQAIRGFSLEYYAPTAFGSSGSPLLRLSGEAIGVHRGRYQDDSHSLPALGPRKVATCLTEIIRYFLLKTHHQTYSYASCS